MYPQVIMTSNLKYFLYKKKAYDYSGGLIHEDKRSELVFQYYSG